MSFIQNNLLLIVVFIASGAMLAWPLVGGRLSKMKPISTLGVTRLINSGNPVLLDLRETSEFEGGSLPNALHIPLSQLKDRAGELGKLTGRPLVAFCDRGQKSRGAMATLSKLGFNEIYNLAGGIRAWKDAGLPVVRA
ncbi:MAG TPA: rhodanese-like domain-containing protein [Casimicrobiaceae bacterium]|jgi:rhodanese-related sulfurtransferase|nr:rhodanese-like domain-containing protein [Casimicrobiaceae bacterium]